MAGDDSLEDTIADEDQTADEERDDFQLLGLERFEAEKRDLGVEQITTEERQADDTPTHPVVCQYGNRQTAYTGPEDRIGWGSQTDEGTMLAFVHIEFSESQC